MEWNRARVWTSRLALATLVCFPWCGAAASGTVRPSALAGSWYPREKTLLRDTVDGYYSAAGDARLGGRVFAIIVPHAGYRYSGRVAGWAYRQLKADYYDRVIVLGPSHHASFDGFSIMNVAAYRTPLGDVPLDGKVCEALRGHKLHVMNDASHVQEHAIEIQLPFLQQASKSFKLVPIVVGNLRAGESEAVAAAIRPHLTPKTLLVISSDFTHYGPRFNYVPFKENVEANIRALDKEAWLLILRNDYLAYMRFLDRTQATICGRNAIAILLKLLPRNARGQLLRYDTSGRMTRDYGNSVSYVSMAFAVGAKPSAKAAPRPSEGTLSNAEKKTLLRIARTTLNMVVKTGRVPAGFEKVYPMTAHLKAPAGVFVTLKKQGQLRGCVGRIGYPEQARTLPPLYEGVRLMTVSSAKADRRFQPVQAGELTLIQIEISALSIAAQVRKPGDFEVGKHGIIIRKGDRSAVYLPQVAPEQGWSREQTLSQLCGKAGLPMDEWQKPGMKFFVFTAEVFDETLLTRDMPPDPSLLR